MLENTRFTGAALLLLLALNSTLLVVLILKRPGPPPHFPMMQPPPPGPAGDAAKNYLIRELDFSDEQQAKFETLIDKHRKNAFAIQSEIHGMRDSMVHQLESENPDTTIINSLAQKIGVDQSQLEKNTFHHFLEVKAICNPDQQKKFAEVIGRALQMLAPPPGPRMPPPPPGN